MRAVGVVGYKNSGKTTLVIALAKELIARGHRVATVKHTSGELDFPSGDTAKHRSVVEQVGAISSGESAVFFRGEKRLEDLLMHLDADFVLIEGFKGEQTFPKFACLSGREEDRALFDGLALCAVGSGSLPDSAIPMFDPQRDLDVLADLVEKHAFKLPNLNCGACGYQTCAELAREIVAGTRSLADCVALHPSAEVRIDGTLMAINPFIGRIIARTIEGMLSALKGFKKGKIEIKIG
ncbi:MAG: molybdopterin-guanine dinucleotide biosynthesis protein B [Candidatus Latescibacterota bacterium]